MKRVTSILLVTLLVGIVAFGVGLAFQRVTPNQDNESRVPSSGVGVASQRLTPPTQDEVLAVIEQMDSDELTEMDKRVREALPADQKELVRELRRARDVPATLVATVNGEEVMLSDMERHRAQLNADAKLSVVPFTVNDQMVAHAVIREKVILAEARNRGLLPTQEEIDRYTEWRKGLYDELHNADPDAYDKESRALAIAVINAYIEGWGVSEDVFWSEIAPEEHARDLVIIKLRDDVMDGLDSIDRAKVWDEFVDGLISKAQVKVIEQDSFRVE